MKTKSSVFAVIKTFTLLLLVCFLFSSCAEAQPKAIDCTEGNPYGFFGGLWHGLILPFSFVGSLFSDDIAIWAVNNTGNWYSFGFVLGAASALGGSSAASSK